MLNALTIDIEDYYHVSVFQPYITMDEWKYLPSRVEANTMKILDLLDKQASKATFFILGCVAKKKPALVREIYENGHEVACHGYAHKLAYEMTPDAFRADVRKAKTIIEDSIGAPVTGFRATSFSIVSGNLWCLDILIEEGFLYDSSIFPIYRRDYGIPSWERFPHLVSRPSGVIYELPPSTTSIFNNRLPVAGGAYLRFFPFNFITAGIRRINNVELKAAILYVHPWEFDTGQPRIKVKKLAALRHYTGIGTLENKFRKILTEFEFGTATDVIDKTLS